MAHNILIHFPIISRADLVYGNKCSICHSTYITEDAVRLPCGHEFGSDCITTWLSPQQGKNTCPLCRQELFPVAPESAAEDDGLVHFQSWNDMATALNLELRPNNSTVHRSPPFPDSLLHTQLEAQGARLPSWRPGSADPGSRLDSSLFREIRHRGAFRALPVSVGRLLSERRIWGYLRGRGYAYDPMYAATACGCAWFRS